MTFKRLFEYRGMQNNTYFFTPRKYFIDLFDSALNTNYFDEYQTKVSLTVRVAPGADENLRTLFLSLHLNETVAINFREDNVKANESFRSIALELLMLWLVEAAHMRRDDTLEHIVMLLNNNLLAYPQYFDMFAFRQLMTQDFQDVSRFYICNLVYIDTIVANYHLKSATDFRATIAETFKWLNDNRPNATREEIWVKFTQLCKSKGIDSLLRFSVSDREELINFFQSRLQKGNVKVYPVKTNVLAAALNSPIFKIWSDFSSVFVRKMLYPRVQAFSIQC